MISLEYLDLISSVAWNLFEKVTKFQDKFWLTTPIHWDSITKHASYKPVSKCIPLLVLSLMQIPIYSFSFLILYWQTNPKTADPRFPLAGVVMMTFGSVMNFFITWGSFSNFHKRKEWTLCLNLVGEAQFHHEKRHKRKKSIPLANMRIMHKWTFVDIVTEVIFINFIFLGSAGFVFPFVLDADPISYIFIDLPKHTTLWYIIRFVVRPLFWGLWTFYSVWTFYNVVTYIFFAILHGCMVIPRVPKLALRQTLLVIQNTIANLTFPQRLAIQLMEGAYREYRQFQIFIRPANDAMYVVVPDGLSGIGAVSIIGGFATIKTYNLFPLNIYLLFPSVFCMTTILIFMMVPIACNVFESAVDFKMYWLSRFTRKEVRKRLKACRPMGIAAGPFGYVHRSLPMSMGDTIVDCVCSLTLSIDV